jgi:hypothetical protein
MFCHRNQIRRWAARVLLLWLLGLGIGVAHACLAPAAARSAGPQMASAVGQPSPSAPAVAAEASQFGAHHAQHEAGQARPSSVVKSNCQDFCDKARVTIPPLKATPGDMPGLALPPAAVAVVLPAPVFQPVRLAVPGREGVATLPIALAFVRLAL